MPYVTDPTTGRRVWQANPAGQTGVFAGGQPWQPYAQVEQAERDQMLREMDAAALNSPDPVGAFAKLYAEYHRAKEISPAYRARMDAERAGPAAGPEGRVTALETPGLGKIVPYGGATVDETLGRIKTAKSDVARIEGPSPEEEAMRVQQLAAENYQRQQAEDRAERARRAQDGQNVTRIRVLAGGGTNEQAELAARVAGGAELDAGSYTALRDLAGQDIGRASKMSRVGRGRSEAAGLLAKVDADMRAGEQAATAALAGREFADRAAYQQAVEQAVAGVPAQVRGLVAGKLLASVPKEIKADEKQRRELAITTEEMQKRDAADLKRKVVARLESVYGAGNGETVYENPVHAQERADIEAEIMGVAQSGERGAKATAKKDVEAGRIDFTDPKATDVLVASGATSDARVKAATEFADTALPVKAGSVRVAEQAVSDAVQDVLLKIDQGIPASEAVTQALGDQELSGMIVVADADGRASVTAQIKRGVAEKIKADATTASARRVAADKKAETEQITQAVEAATAPNALPDDAGYEAGLYAVAGEAGLAGVDPRQQAATRLLGQMQGSLSGDTLEAAREVSQAWLDGTVTGQQAKLYGPFLQALGAEAGRWAQHKDVLMQAGAAEQAVATRKQEREQAERDAVTEANGQRGLMTLWDTDEKGEPVQRTFSVSDPEQVTDYYRYMQAGADERVQIAARQATRREVQEKAAAFALKQSDLLAQGLVTVRIAERIPNSMTGYVESELPLRPQTEEDWDDYMLYLREGTTGSPAAYAQLYEQAEASKEKWQSAKAKALAKQEGIPLPEAEKMMDDLAAANEEWSVAGETMARGTRNALVGAGATLRNSDKSRKGRTRESARMADEQFAPAEQAPKQADVPEGFKFADAAAAEKAGQAGKIPDNTYVLVDGKMMLWTKE